MIFLINKTARPAASRGAVLIYTGKGLFVFLYEHFVCFIMYYCG